VAEELENMYLKREISMQAIPTETRIKAVLDPENSVEMVRLDNQNRLMTEALGGILPEAMNLTNVSHILDVGCGAGGWTMDTAFALETSCVGVDSRSPLLKYARMQAQMTGINDLVTFQEMEIACPLAFPDASFDLVNLRFLTELIETQCWPAVLHECLRVLKQDGYLVLTEAEWPTNSSPAAEQLARSTTEALWKAGFGFSRDGRDLGIIHALPALLKRVGACAVQSDVHLLNFSSRQPHFHDMARHLWTTYALLQPFLTNMGYGSQQEVYELCDQFAHDVIDDTFEGGMIVLRTWGHKGGEPEPEEHCLPPIFPSLRK